MSISTVITEGFGPSASVPLIIIQGFGVGAAPPIPVSTIPMGGAGYPAPHDAWKRRTLWDKVSEWVDEDFRELYAEVTAKDAPAEVRKEAAAVVKPFAKARAEVPRVTQVDWMALQRNEEALAALVDIYRRHEARQRSEEEEMILLAIL